MNLQLQQNLAQGKSYKEYRSTDLLIFIEGCKIEGHPLDMFWQLPLTKVSKLDLNISKQLSKTGNGIIYKGNGIILKHTGVCIELLSS